MVPSDSPSSDGTLADRYRVLLEIARSLAGTLEAEELYRAIHRETRRVIEADGFYISLYDAEADEGTIVFWADGEQHQHSRIPYRGSDSEVLRTGEGCLVGDGLEDRSLLLIGQSAEEGPVTRSAVSAPLRAGDSTFGAISAQSYRPHAFSRSDLELLKGIADVAAVAGQNARYVEELRRRRREAEGMEEIVRALSRSLDTHDVLNEIVRAAIDLLSADDAVVWLIEDEAARVGAAIGAIAPSVDATLPLEGEMVRRLIEDHVPVIIDDIAGSLLLTPRLKEGIRAASAMIVPLVGSEGILGALSLGSAEKRAFSRDELRLLLRLSGHATSALANARLHAALQRISLTDPLTGLPNRRHLEMHLSREFAAAERGRRLAVAVFDLDNFKQFNDTLGHVAGDDALRFLGKLLAGETRAMNLVARYGGDEFLAVLSDAPEDGARLHAGRVAERIARESAERGAPLTVSWGVATYSDRMKSVSELIHEADADMYRSKQGNRVPSR